MLKQIAVVLFVLGLTSPTWTAPVQEPPEYPDGQMCSPSGDRLVGPGMGAEGKLINDHACTCHRVDHSADCDGTPIEHAKCLQYCHPKHCRCPVHCEVPAAVTHQH